ncbi:AraC-like ligand binding domain protein [compost metagenome]
MREGDMVIIPPDTPHRYGAAAGNPWSIYWFHFKGDHAARLVSLFGLAAVPLTLSPSGIARFTEWFQPAYELLAERTYSLTSHVHVAQTTRQLLYGAGPACRPVPAAPDPPV